MQAIVVHETGGPDVLQLEEVPEVAANDGRVVVRVELAGVNHMDLNMRAGMAPTLPFTPGLDAAGTRTDSGERVLVSGALGCYGELVAANPDAVWALPDEISAATAVALGVPFRLAWWALIERARLQGGETVLVQAGSSATGSAAVQIARAVGATVHATASPAKHDRLRDLGAEPHFYTDDQLADLGASLVFDPVGGPNFSRSLDALAADGRLITPGAVDDPRVTFNIWTVMEKRLQIIGAGAVPPRPEDFQRLLQMTADGRLRPEVDRELPLAHAAEAHRLIEAREVFGKIALRP